MRRLTGVLFAVCVVEAAAAAWAQEPSHEAPPAVSSASDAPVSPSREQGGLAAPDSERLKVQLDLLAGWSYDGANASLGFEQQGRVGYAIVTLHGRVHPRVSYHVAINPVDEVEPLPACGEPDYFYPNEPTFLYPDGANIPCEPKNGNRRVDGYRGIALDLVRQQGPIREAYVDLDITDAVAFRIGRMRLPLGFDWEAAGSMSAKDAARLQRINAEASFGAMFSYRWRSEGRTHPLVSASVAGVLGEGNRFWDYDYFYFEDGSLDSNSALTAIGHVTARPSDALQVRLSVKRGFTGSKVERRPSYWASKRNDHAVIAGAEWTPVPYVRVLGEWARYTWGPTRTSAELIGFDRQPIRKAGYWVTAETSYPLRDDLRVGVSWTNERVDRADSLVKFMAANQLHNVSEGKKDRLSVFRLFADIGPFLRVGLFRADDLNPFPWLSGMWPVGGPKAFSGREPDKYGMMLRLRVR